MKRNEIPAEMMVALNKDLDAIKAKYELSAMVACEEMRDEAISEFKDYVDMMDSLGISLASL